MSAWLDGEGRLFNPRPRVSAIPIAEGHECIVVDEALAEPERLRQWAASQRLVPPVGYPYPGLVHEVPESLSHRVAEFFSLHARGRLGARRLQELVSRLAMVCTTPEELEPRQWQCHRDRVADDPARVLFAASVLYLFDDPALGGTSFYRPRLPPEQIERMLVDSQRLDAAAFTARWGVQRGYMAGSNACFERIARVPAAFNRMVFYDGGIFHSADVDDPARLSRDPARGRLTLTSFFTCRRSAS